MSNIKYIDCHSHPHDKTYGGDESFLAKLESDGGGTIAIGTDYTETRKAIDLAKRHDNVWATIGIHPADNHKEVYDEKIFNDFLATSEGKVVGIGECGLDYFYFGRNPELDIEAEKSRQKQIFVFQIEFAIKNNLPLVLHGRPSRNTMDAYRDMLGILEGYKGVRGHAHFFVGNMEITKRFLDLGMLLSFDGPITFTKEYDEVIKYIPMQNIMIETDSPYAAPMPYRGQTNYPHYVKEVAKRIGELKGLSEDEVLSITMQNAKRLFGLNI